MNDRQLLDEVVEFRSTLIDYSHKVGNDRTRTEAAKLRTALSLKWGRINPDLTRLGFPNYLEQYGRRFPIMQMVLRDGPLGPDYEAMRTVVHLLEEMIGRLEHRIEERPKVLQRRVGQRLSLGATGVLVLGLLGLAWAFGRFQDAVWNDLARRYAWSRDQIFTGNRPWAILAAIVALIAGGLFVNQISKDKWIGAFRRRPTSTLVYLILTIVATTVGVILANS